MLMRRTDSEAGFTLVELLVVMTILTIVGGIVTATVVRSIQVTHRAQQRAESLATLQNTLQRIGREVRAADPLRFDLVMSEQPSQEIGLEVHRANQTHDIRYYVSDGDLVEDRTIYDASGNPVESVTGRLLVNDVDSVLFEYYDEIDENDLAVSTPDPGSVGIPLDCVDLTPSDLTNPDCRARYELTNYVRINVTTDLVRTQDQNIQTLINLRNAQ